MKDEFDVSESFLRESIRERRIFSAMYLPEYFKTDIFPMRDTPLAREQMNRRIRVLFARDPHRTVSMLTPEDLILSKLDWYVRAMKSPICNGAISKVCSRFTPDAWMRNIFGALRNRSDFAGCSIRRFVANADLKIARNLATNRLTSGKKNSLY